MICYKHNKWIVAPSISPAMAQNSKQLAQDPKSSLYKVIYNLNAHE